MMLPAFLTLLLVQFVPFLVTSVPPLVDYPNHLARIYLLTHLPEIPQLQALYRVQWRLLPNLSFDVLGAGLALILPTLLAGTMSLLITATLIPTGVLALSAAIHGRSFIRGCRPFSLLAFMFVLSEPFYFGFIGFMISVGLCLWCIAVWLLIRHRPLWMTIPAVVAMSLVLYLSHLVAVAAFGVVIGSIEFQRLLTHRPAGRSMRDALVPLAVAALPAVIVAIIFIAQPSVPTGLNTIHWSRKWYDIGSIVLSPVRNVSDALDLATLSVILSVLAFGLWSGQFRIAREMWLALAALAALSLVIPDQVVSSYFAHIRLPPIIALLVCASGDWRARPRTILWGGAALAALFCIHTAVVTRHLADRGAFLDRLRAALQDVQPGQRLASTTVRPPNSLRLQQGWDHGVSMAVIDHSAYVANLFTIVGQQPLQLAPAARDWVRPPHALTSDAPDALTPQMFADLDFFVLMNPKGLDVHLPAVLKLVHQDPEFAVFSVSH